MRIALSGADKWRGLSNRICKKASDRPRFLAFCDSALAWIVILWEPEFRREEHDGAATRRSAEGPVASGAGQDYRQGPPAGAAGAANRLAVPRWALRRGVPGGSGPARPADAAGSGPLHPEAHAQFVGRGAVRALARETLLPNLLRRAELLPQAAVRPLVADALAPAAR